MFISRDPFAKKEMHKERLYSNKTCGFCGQTKETKNKRKYLFQYRIEPDSIGSRKNIINGLFCSIACMKDYHH
jgi:hypothetical protein